MIVKGYIFSQKNVTLDDSFDLTSVVTDLIMQHY